MRHPQRHAVERRKGSASAAPVLRAVRPTALDDPEQRLAELLYGLHDGPLQSIAALGAEVALFSQQLADVLRAHDLREQLLGRAADVAARVAALDDELREIAFSARSEVPDLPLTAALEREVEQLMRDTSIRAIVETAGQLDSLSRQDRVCVFRFVQSALANVRQHSSATNVAVEISCEGARIRAAVSDDGLGFDVEQALLRAAAAGRLGLVGMAERARGLGGTMEIDTRDGGPTTVTATWPVVTRGARGMFAVRPGPPGGR